MPIRLKIVLACLMFSLISAGVGAFAVGAQSRLGGLAVTIYDRAYVGTSYAGHAQTDFLRFLSLREGALGVLAADVARRLLDGVADTLDVAAERATSAKARALAQGVRARVAGVAAAIDPAEPGGADLPTAELAGIDADLAATVHRFGMDGLEARDAADGFVARTHSLLWRVILGAVGLTVVVGLMLDRAIIPSLRRGVDIARAIAGGELDNAITVRGRSETAHLLRALATMQAAIAGSIARTRALHEAEARQQQVHEAELTHTLGPPAGAVRQHVRGPADTPRRRGAGRERRLLHHGRAGAEGHAGAAGIGLRRGGGGRRREGWTRDHHRHPRRHAAAGGDAVPDDLLRWRQRLGDGAARHPRTPGDGGAGPFPGPSRRADRPGEPVRAA